MAEIKKISTELQLLDKFLDTSGDAGTSGQVLTSTGTGINWISGGNIPGVPAGSGTVNTIALWTPDGDTLGNSIITQPTSAEVRVAGTLKVNSTVTGYSSTKIQTGGFGDSQSGINILNSTTGYGYILFGDGSGADLYKGQITYKHGDDFMAFNTNGSEKIRITSGGNVGIGTTSPDYKLEVQGVISSADAGLQKATFANVGNDLVLTANADATNVTAKILFNSSGAGGTGVSTKMIIDGSGKVGIGTTSPLKKLSINGGNVAVNNGNSFIVGAAITGNSQIGELGADSGQLQLLTESTRDIKFGSTTYGNIMFLEGTNGNVGIGTTAPTANLHVQGSSATDAPIVRVGGFGNSGSTLELAETLTSGNMTYGFSFEQTGNGTNELLIKRHNNSAGGASVITLSRTNNNVSMSGGLSLALKATSSSTLSTDGGTTLTTKNYVDALTPGAGVFLPLAGGTMTGSIDFGTNNKDISMTDSAGAVTRVMVLNTSNTMYIGPVDPYAGGSIIYGAAAGVSYQRWYTGASERMRIMPSGNVGIGTTIPDSLLHVSADVTGANTGTITIEGRPTGFLGDDIATIDFHNSGNKRADIRMERGNTADDSQLVFSTSDTGTLNDALIINEIGNVGIGTTSPASTLHVLGPNAASGGITLSSGTSNNTQKVGRIKTSHYSNSEEPFTAILTNAQTSTNVLRLGGGSGAENAATVILFYTATNNTTLTGSERMRISSNGSVGINSTSTSYKLDVGGNARFLDSVYINTSTGSGGLFVTRLGGASESLKIYTTDTSSYLDVYQDENQSGYGNLAFRADDTGNNNGYLWFGHRSGGEAMRIIDNGNVGIGTTAPNYKLTAYGSSTDSEIVASFGSANDQNEYTAIGLSGFIASNGATKAGLALKRTATYGTGELHFLNNNTLDNSDMTLSDSKMMIDSTGNVGIGTSSPGSKLHIDSTGEALRFTRSSQETYRVIHGTSGLYFTGPNTGSLVFGVTQNSDVDMFNTSGSVMFRADGSTGNVGIGTTSPGSKLQVAGEIRAADGNKGAPSYSFTSDTNTGMYSDTADQLEFVTGGNIAMVIDSNSNVGIGTSAPDVKFHVTENEDGSGLDKGTAKFINTNTGQGATTMHMVQTSSSNFANAVKFWQGSTPTAVGFIRLTTSSTLFITSASDLNLKKNITNWSDDTLGKFKALEPKKFRFKTQDVSEDKTLGFIAQNEVDNFPEAYPQFLGDDEKPYYGFNPTGMVPHLMKAIKDLVEKVEILENKITQLENNN